MLDLTFDNVVCLVDGPPEEIAVISKELTFSVTAARFTTAYRRKRWDGKKSLFNISMRTFPTGLIPYIRSKLDRKSIPYSLTDRRPAVRKDTLNVTMQGSYELRDYQENAVNTYLNQLDWGRGIIKLPTRSGKTVIGGAIIQALNVPSLFVVPTKDLLEQTCEELHDKYGVEAGRMGDGAWNPQRVTVALIDSLSIYFGAPRKRKIKPKRKGESEREFKERQKRFNEGLKKSVDRWLQRRSEVEEYLRSVICMVVDECHSSSTSYVTVAKYLESCRYRIGLSATPLMGDKENKLTTRAMLGDIVFTIDMEKLIQAERIVRPTVYFVLNGSVFVDSSEFDDEYYMGIVKNRKRNLLVAIAAAKLRRKGLDTLVLVEKIEHGKCIHELLKNKFQVKFVTGSNSSEERQQVLNELRAGISDIVIATRIFNQGVDIPYLGAVIIGGGYKSAVLVYQRYGRPITKVEKKKKAIIVDFNDVYGQWLPKHSEERIKLCEKNPAFDLHFLDSIDDL